MRLKGRGNPALFIYEVKMTDNEIEKLLKELKELNAHFELQNFEAKKVLDKIENEMKVEFPNGFKMKILKKKFYWKLTALGLKSLDNGI